jgi:hypothetical protein
MFIQGQEKPACVTPGLLRGLMGFVYLGIYQIGNIYFFDTYMLSDQFMVSNHNSSLEFCANYNIAGSLCVEKSFGHGHLGKNYTVQIHFGLDDH